MSINTIELQNLTLEMEAEIERRQAEIEAAGRDAEKGKLAGDAAAIRAARANAREIEEALLDYAGNALNQLDAYFKRKNSEWGEISAASERAVRDAGDELEALRVKFAQDEALLLARIREREQARHGIVSTFAAGTEMYLRVRKLLANTISECAEKV